MFYDYTPKRLGSKQPPHNKKVIICGKCGKRGTDDGVLENKKTGKVCQLVTHCGHIVSMVIAFFHTDEWCSYFVRSALDRTPVPAGDEPVSA